AHDRARGQIRLDADVEQAGNRAGRIVRVERAEHHVAGQRRLDGDLRRLVVADLPYHDHVGVLADDVAQPGGKSPADLRPDVDLVDAGKLILDRVLDGDDLLLVGVDLAQGRVEARRLAASRRPRHEQDPVRARDEAAEARQGNGRDAQFFETEERSALVQDTHHHALAVERRYGGDADIDLAAAHPQADPAVLGQAPLGDIHLRKDLDAGDDGGLEPLRRRRRLAQHAVNAVAHFELPLERLDVDVAGALLHGLVDEHVDELDDERLPRHLLQVGDVGPFVQGRVDLTLRHVLDHPLHGELLQGTTDLSGARDYRFDGHSRRQPHVIRDLQI